MENQRRFEALAARVRAWIDGQRERSFDQLALSVFELQFDLNPAYQQFCRALAKTPDHVRDWRDIPAVITSAFKDADFTILPPGNRSAVFYSSGTTARERSRHFHSAASLSVYEASLIHWFKPFVLPDRDQVDFLLLSPPPSEAPHSSLVHMFETVSRAFGRGAYYGRSDAEGAWRLDFERLQSVAHPGPVVICGTAFSFVHWCDWLRENGLRLQFPQGSRVFETGGYKGRSRSVAKAELHPMISAALGLPEEHIISEYGMSELSSQAYDRRCGSREARLFRFPPWAPVRVINPETGEDAPEGEPGLIRVCDLANVASVMSVQTEDLGVRRGDAFELLGRSTLVEARGCSLLPAS